jgi:hypothetical protein
MDTVVAEMQVELDMLARLRDAQTVSALRAGQTVDYLTDMHRLLDAGTKIVQYHARKAGLEDWGIEAEASASSKPSWVVPIPPFRTNEQTGRWYDELERLTMGYTEVTKFHDSLPRITERQIQLMMSRISADLSDRGGTTPVDGTLLPPRLDVEGEDFWGKLKTFEMNDEEADINWGSSEQSESDSDGSGDRSDQK